MLRPGMHRQRAERLNRDFPSFNIYFHALSCTQPIIIYTKLAFLKKGFRRLSTDRTKRAVISARNLANSYNFCMSVYLQFTSHKARHKSRFSKSRSLRGPNTPAKWPCFQVEFIPNVVRFILLVADESRANCCQIRGVETHCSVKISCTTEHVPDKSINSVITSPCILLLSSTDRTQFVDV
jgi:hypothetical protein